jgi:hypothetical protein
LSLLLGCSAIQSPPSADPARTLDEDAFRCQVEPILARDCSYFACHGHPQRPLRIYSVGKLRDPDLPYEGINTATLAGRQLPLSAGARCGTRSDERHANFTAAAGFAAGGVAPNDNLLLRKPLPPEAGGYQHEGGVLFSGRADPRAQAIRDWLSGGMASCAPPVCGNADAGAP